MILRTERPEDYDQVEELIRLAFEKEEMSDHQEHDLVRRLREAPDFIPELSLVCEVDDQLVGHILFTKIKIVADHQITDSLALAPVSVLPKYQNRGIGSKLIEEGHRRALALGFNSIVVLGHAAYYPKFGYQKSSTYGIQLPFEVPDENSMIIELKPGSLKCQSAKVVYPEAFGIV